VTAVCRSSHDRPLRDRRRRGRGPLGISRYADAKRPAAGTMQKGLSCALYAFNCGRDMIRRLVWSSTHVLPSSDQRRVDRQTHREAVVCGSWMCRPWLPTSRCKGTGSSAAARTILTINASLRSSSRFACYQCAAQHHARGLSGDLLYCAVSDTAWDELLELTLLLQPSSAHNTPLMSRPAP
jgi:hypothetical protein